MLKIPQIISSLLLISSLSLASTSSDNLAESLMELRAEVESLDSQIQDMKDEHKSSMKSLVMQKNDLESTIARENLKIKQLNVELAKTQKLIKDLTKNSKGLKPVVLKALAELEKSIKRGIPFKVEDRIADLNNIKRQLNENLLTPQKALSLAWNSYADTIRMSKENGLFKQTIKLDGKDVLVQIARVGSLAIFFRTPDDRVGYVSKDANGWFYKEELNKEKKEMVLNLFDAYKKQIRSGYFELPNAMIRSVK